MRKLTARQAAEIRRIAAMRDEDIDKSDLPELLDWSGAVRGKFYRPVKQPVTIRLDADVLEWFRAQGEGYQTRVNQALRDYIARQEGAAKPKSEVHEPAPSYAPRRRAKGGAGGQEAAFRKLERLGITEADLRNAVRWARRKRK